MNPSTKEPATKAGREALIEGRHVVERHDMRTRKVTTYEFTDKASAEHLHTQISASGEPVISRIFHP